MLRFASRPIASLQIVLSCRQEALSAILLSVALVSMLKAVDGLRFRVPSPPGWLDTIALHVMLGNNLVIVALAQCYVEENAIYGTWFNTFFFALVVYFGSAVAGVCVHVFLESPLDRILFILESVLHKAFRQYVV